MTLFDLDGVFVLGRRPSQVDVLANRIAAELAGRGKQLASLRRMLYEVQEEHS